MKCDLTFTQSDTKGLLLETTYKTSTQEIYDLIFIFVVCPEFLF